MTAEEFLVHYGLNGRIRDGFGLFNTDPPEIIDAFYNGEDDKVKEWLLRKRGYWVRT